MGKRMSVVFCGVALAVLTAGYASAQTATQDAKEKTQAAAKKTAAVVTDAEITTAVKTKLLADKAVGGLKIDVDTTNGVVTLSGTVDSGVERARALRLARNTKGVKSVKNKLVMNTAATSGRKDKDGKAAEAKEATKDAAEKTKEATKEAAEKTKEATKGAAEKTKEVTTDAAITSAVKTKFLADTQVGGLRIDVDTKDGVVTLTGNVKSAAEKAEAIRLAKTTKGVKSVVDKLTIQP